MKNEKKTNSPKKPMGLRQKLFKTSVSRPGLKQLEEEIKLFNNLINQSNDAIAVVEPETGRFLYVNDKVCNNLGYSRGELLNMKVVDIVAIIRDITERKQAEEKTRKLNEELEQKVIERTLKFKEANRQLKEQIIA